MPILVKNGPDIPVNLLHAQEEGKLVFFCGAGISCSAELPLFGHLVDELYSAAGESQTASEKSAYDKFQYDMALCSLESRIVGGRTNVRKNLAAILTPNCRKKHALTMHKALLRLGTTREGALHLITTNYDHLFHIANKHRPLKEFAAPLLPIPKPSQWDGLIYLHGLLPKDNNERDLDRLILSSADFGLAYLTERWASRFLTELFRHYVVCFVGYSLNDPVLRYMTDALAADRTRGDAKLEEFYAFASFSSGEEEQKSEEWKAKSVTPILYKEIQSKGGKDDHSNLYNTFNEWAERYRDGLSGKKKIIAKFATTPPLSAFAHEDEAVSNVLWALTDEQAAKFFSEMTPTPPLDWLGPLFADQFTLKDLQRFGSFLAPSEPKNINFSMLCRPAPYTTSPMRIVGINWNDHLTPQMFYLAKWLLKHLGNPELALWLANQGGNLHPHFASLLELELFAAPESLIEDQQSPPRPLVTQEMKNIWSLFLTGIIAPPLIGYETRQIVDQIRNQGLSSWLRELLRKQLAPRVTLSKAYSWLEQEKEGVQGKLRWDVTIQGNDLWTATKSLDPEDNLHWKNALIDLITDFDSALHGLAEVKKALDEDRAFYDTGFSPPSIEKHPQNRHSDKWGGLVELLRDSWIAVASRDPERAKNIARSWWQKPYPIFKRLALFAAKRHDIIPITVSSGWILEENGAWLWSHHIHRELLRYFATLGANIDTNVVKNLEKAILEGPPDDRFKKEKDPKELARLDAHATWLRLAKLNQGNVSLSSSARRKVLSLSKKYGFNLRDEERDEFLFWMEVGWRSAPDTSAPRNEEELYQYLKKNPEAQWHDDDWASVCREDFPLSLTVLRRLAQEGLWPASRWDTALHAWVDEELQKRFETLATDFDNMPDDTFQTVSLGVSRLLSKFSELRINTDCFFQLCDHIIRVHDKESAVTNTDLVTAAINSPMGNVAEALITAWFSTSTKDVLRLEEKYKKYFTTFCDTTVPSYAFARAILCMNTYALWRADEEWFQENLLPLFNWDKRGEEAKDAWQGFLFSPRLSPDLAGCMKESLLKACSHYEILSSYSEHYASLMVYIALESDGTFTNIELRNVFNTLPQEGLKEALRAIIREIESGEDSTSAYWENRIIPFFTEIWPKDRQHLNSEIAEQLAGICIEAGKNFGKAFDLLKPWLIPVKWPDMPIYRMNAKDNPWNITRLAEHFPHELLQFLKRIIGDATITSGAIINDALETIKNTTPSLVRTLEFKILAEKFSHS